MALVVLLTAPVAAKKLQRYVREGHSSTRRAAFRSGIAQADAEPRVASDRAPACPPSW